MGQITEDLGIISAYGYALTKGFKGTEEEFAEMMAGVKDYYLEAKKLATSSNAVTAKSWTAGGTGTREGEDEDNARYYANQADQSRKDAEQSKLAAEEYKNDILESADKAKKQAKAAEASAANAADSEKNLSEAEPSARESASAALQAKKDTEQLKADAGASAAAAGKSEEKAGEYKSAAEAAAQSAAGYAGEAEYRIGLNPATGHPAIYHYTN